MTIREPGSLGEVVVALGFIVTLVFLAMEMRLMPRKRSWLLLFLGTCRFAFSIESASNCPA